MAGRGTGLAPSKRRGHMETPYRLAEAGRRYPREREGRRDERPENTE